MRKTNILLLGLVFASAIFAFHPQLWKLYKSNAGGAGCENTNQFKNDTGLAEGEDRPNSINESGTVHYFKDNFSGYSKNSRLIEQFDDLENYSLSGNYQHVGLNNDRIGGKNSLSLQLTPLNQEFETLSIKKSLNQPLDLSRWNDTGVLSTWLKIENRKGISGVGLKIGDNTNNYRTFQVIKNLQMDIPNNYDSDDVYPDVSFASGTATPTIWTDFWLNEGWNYLFWKINKLNYADTGKVDMKNISWFEISVQEDKNLSPQEILLDDFRIVDGLQKNANSLGNNWYPPDNEPQNGIYDWDVIGENSYSAKLLNISESQYPTNGNHGRMVLAYGTPLNFSLRTRFILTNFPKTRKERTNNWFRVAYDFDSSFDAGHDWFGSFISFEWNKFGLTTVIPIEKDNIQEWEPKSEDTLGSSVDFTPQENIPYEIQLTVRGQKAIASIYEVRGNCLALKGTTEYEFRRPRHGEDKRYPFCLGITGNIKASILEFEIKEL